MGVGRAVVAVVMEVAVAVASAGCLGALSGEADDNPAASGPMHAALLPYYSMAAEIDRLSPLLFTALSAL